MQSLEVNAIHNQINEILTSFRENPHVNTCCEKISVVGMGSMLNLSVEIEMRRSLCSVNEFIYMLITFLT